MLHAKYTKFCGTVNVENAIIIPNIFLRPCYCVLHSTLDTLRVFTLTSFIPQDQVVLYKEALFFFQCFIVWACTSRQNDPEMCLFGRLIIPGLFQKQSTSLHVKWTYVAWLFPRLSSQNTAFCKSCCSWRASTWWHKFHTLIHSFYSLHQEHLGSWPPFGNQE